MSTTDTAAARRGSVGLVLLMLPVFMAALDMTVLFLAMPTIAAELLPSGTQQLWVLHVGDIAGAALVLTAGRLVDRFGPRALLCLGMVGYGAASAVAAFAPTVEVLIVARMLLGASAVTMAPAGVALLRTMFPEPRRFTRALAWFMAAFSGGMAFGPPLGGLLLEHFWWGSIFLVNVPIAVAVATLAPRLLPPAAGRGSGRVDVVSVLASALGIAAVVYGGQELAASGWDPWSAAALSGGLVLVGAFVVRQRSLADPLLDLGLFRAAPFAIGLLAIWLVITATAGADLQLAQHLQVVLGHSALAAGALLVVPAVASVAATAASPVLLRWMRPGRAIAFGAAVALVGAAGAAAVVTAGTGAPTALLVIAAALVAAGVAPAFALGTDVVLSSAPAERTGSAQATQEVAGSLGNTAGIALGGTVAYLAYSGTVRAELPAEAGDELARRSMESIGGALDAAGSLPPDVAARLTDAAQTAFTAATRDAYLVATAGLLAVAVVTFRGLRNVRRQEEDR